MLIRPAGRRLALMPEAPPTRARIRRHPWPRVLVRIRRVWFGVVEVVSFFAAGLAAMLLATPTREAWATIVRLAEGG